MEDFSLIILCRRQGHLISQTLDTLKPQKSSFEVLILDGEGTGRLGELEKSYPELKLRILNARGSNLGEMMNEGLGLARGRYIQFLEPGDRYISQHGLEFLSGLIEKKPHLIYANSLTQGAVSSTDFISTRSPWFLKSKLFELGGFDRLLTTCPDMDLLCKLFLDRNAHATFCNRVLIQSDLSRPMPFGEMYRILYRHFGIWGALKRFFSQNRSHLLQKASTFFKQTFWSR